MKNLIIGILFFLVIILGAWLLFYNRAEAPASDILNNGNIIPTSPSPTTPVIVTPPQSGEGLIIVKSPIPGQIITSPLQVSGDARGYWFFEASAPVKILDANGKELGIAPVQAVGEWMTENFVPFKGSIIFSKPTTKTGTVVFMRDNPSGLPENDRFFSIPVKFVQ